MFEVNAPVGQIEGLANRECDLRGQFSGDEHEALMFLDGSTVVAVDSVDSAAAFRNEREILFSTFVIRAVRYPVKRELVENIIRSWLLKNINI